MSFQLKGHLCFFTIEHLSFFKFRMRMGYVDVKDDIYELTFDI
jgi:hypothetical protein